MKTVEFDVEEGDYFVIESPEGSIKLSILEIDEENEEVLFGIEGRQDLVVQLPNGRQRQILGLPKCKGLPRYWLLFSLILCHSVRKDIFTPLYNEFVEDYVFAKKQVRRRWEKRWVGLAFSVRTFKMLFACVGIQYRGIISNMYQKLLSKFFQS